MCGTAPIAERLVGHLCVPAAAPGVAVLWDFRVRPQFLDPSFSAFQVGLAAAVGCVAVARNLDVVQRCLSSMLP